jgi:hypothetical protein
VLRVNMSILKPADYLQAFKRLVIVSANLARPKIMVWSLLQQ